MGFARARALTTTDDEDELVAPMTNGSTETRAPLGDDAAAVAGDGGRLLNNINTTTGARRRPLTLPARKRTLTVVGHCKNDSSIVHAIRTRRRRGRREAVTTNEK